MSAASRAIALSAALLLSACAGRQQVPAPPAPTPAPTPVPLPPPPETALEAGVTLATPALLDQVRAEYALRAFVATCPALLRRQDSSGLTQANDWRDLCDDAATLPPDQAAAFFRDRFEWVRVGSGEAFATGYYEPEIAGSRVRLPGYEVPVYGIPRDLVRCAGPDGNQVRGRLDEQGECLPYYSRGAIEDGALAGETPIAWAADEIDFFFLQIQGSGRLRAPDGTIMRIGYADQNGQPYVAIGKLLRDRQLLPPGGATMGGIVAWMRSQPDGGRSLMRENTSYVFFRELTGPGPIGAMGVPVTERMSVATDPKFVPLGAPVFMVMDRSEASGLWVAQDTGGAIKGVNRFDTFWGAGSDAKRIAGGMSSKGAALILLPKGSVERAQARR